MPSSTKSSGEGGALGVRPGASAAGVNPNQKWPRPLCAGVQRCWHLALENRAANGRTQAQTVGGVGGEKV